MQVSLETNLKIHNLYDVFFKFLFTNTCIDHIFRIIFLFLDDEIQGSLFMKILSFNVQS